jgi:adenylyltransferase/sulfurtransferase
MMPVFPHQSACLRCQIQNPPPPGSTETCDTAGGLGPAIGVIASLQAALAVRILSSAPHSTNSPAPADRSPATIPIPEGIPLQLTIVDVWDGTFRQMDVSALRDATDCPACRQGERLWLNGSQSSASAVLCGRNAVQITPTEKLHVSLHELAVRLESSGTVTSNPFLVRLTTGDPEIQLTVFPDGRAIIKGTEDPGKARTLYSRYIGT